MRVEQLFIKPLNDLQLAQCQSITLCRGVGIEGDRNARVGSPRQVLLVSRPVLDEFALNPGDLQENIVVSGRVEHWSSGQVLQIGSEAQIRLTYGCEPCAYLEQIRKGLARSIQGQRGMLGVVIRSGQISVDDTVQVSATAWPPLPEANRDRFEAFVARIPSGRVVRTSDVLLALGWTDGFYRTIPIFIKKAPPSLPVHRIVAANGALLEKHMPEQRQRLQKEGIPVRHDSIDDAYFWPAEYFQELDG